MTKWKSIAIQGTIAAVLLAIGYGAGHWRSERYHQKCFYISEYWEVSSRIKTVNFLYQHDSDRAIRELERNLDTKAIVFGPADTRPASLTEEDLSILAMIAKHRTAHPFTQPDHPGINDMVKKALSHAPNP
jgi:hypothetical protein